jgi:DNA-binding IclR family transcriptional regulator
MSTASSLSLSVPAVDRAARLLALLEAEARPLSASELARRIGAHKSSVHAVLETLRHHGLLDRDEHTKRYRLGARLVRLGQVAADGLDLPAVARPLLVDLAQQSGETVLLLIRSGADRAMILDRAEAGQDGVRISAPVGLRIPLAAGAVGKAYLAYLPEHERAPFLQRLPRFTAASVVDPEAYRAELQAVLANGYALDDQEYLDGVRACAAPVLGVGSSPLAVVLVVGLVGSFSRPRLRPTAEATQRTALAISRALGA